MSARYVWGKHKKEQVYVEVTDRNATAATFRTPRGYEVHGNNLLLEYSNAYKFDPKSGGFSLTGTIYTIKDNLFGDVQASLYPYAIPYDPNGDHVTYDEMYVNDIPPLSSSDVWFARTTSQFYSKVEVRYGSTSQNKKSFSVRSRKATYDKGDFIETVSSSSPSAYPKDTFDSKFWYEYLGSDSIDPSSVTYSKSELQAGEPVGVSVNPQQPTYGGTVSYQFSYSVDGGKTWVNIGSKTTALSVSVTIPDGAQQFRARAIASDNWGFTSATPVYGTSLGVSGLKAYVGVGTKARAVEKIYIGVNGKAREVVKGYIGVNGKARMFL